jgi:hypothetical protein
MNKYLGIIFTVDSGSGETFSLSREVETDNKRTVYDFLLGEAKLDDDSVDSILLIENGADGECPQVKSFWTACNGDFSFRGLTADDDPVYYDDSGNEQDEDDE